MSLRKELQQMQNLTEREEDLRRYLLANPEQVGTLSSRELAEATFTSAATVTRFCKKLGCKGYPDFKLRFVSELRAGPQETESAIQISQRENIVSAVEKMAEMQIQSVEATRREISLEQLIRVSRLVHEAEHLDFYAYDANVHLAHYACNQFFHAGKPAYVYSASNLQGLNALLPHQKQMAFLLSHTGENSKLVEIAKLLRKNKTPCVVITTGPRHTLSTLADECLCACADDRIVEASLPKYFASAKYLLDVLYTLEFSYQYDRAMWLNQSYEKIGERALWHLVHRD